MRSSYIHLRGIPKVTGVSDVLNCLWFNALELLVFCKLGYILMILYLPLPHIFLVQPTMHFHIMLSTRFLFLKRNLWDLKSHEKCERNIACQYHRQLDTCNQAFPRCYFLWLLKRKCKMFQVLYGSFLRANLDFIYMISYLTVLPDE